MATADKLAAPLLEEGSIDPGEGEPAPVPYAARLLRIAAKLFAKACGVAIAWSWADAIHSSFSEHFVPVYLTAATGLLYAVVMTFFTTFMVKYIAEGAGDPDNVQYGTFGMHSRELLLIVQPMMLAWAWKDAFREVIWDRLPQDSAISLIFYRLIFAGIISLVMAYVITQLALKVEEQRVAGEDGTFTSVAMSLLSASFGLFIAWCWNSVAQALGKAISNGEAATAVTTTLYAVSVTALAAYITAELANQIRSFAESTADRNTKPVWLKFIDLLMASLGYIVGWAWSDAAVHLLLETFAFSDMKMLYLVYTVLVTGAGVVFSTHMARVLSDPGTPVLIREYMTLLLNALALMTGWAWKSYIQYFVNLLSVDGAGRVMSNWFQAIFMTLAACYIYHKICNAAKAKISEAEENMVNRAGNQMD